MELYYEVSLSDPITPPTNRDQAIKMLKTGCIEGDIGTVKLALEFGLKKSDIDAPFPQAATLVGRLFPLTTAVWSSERYHLQYSALHYVAQGKKFERIGEYCDIITLLVREYGANPQVLNYMGNSPLHIAIYNKRIQLAATLLRVGADPNIKNNPSKLINTVNWLKSPDDYDIPGSTPLHYTIKYFPDKEMLKCLLDINADCEIENALGESALAFAARKGFNEMVTVMNCARLFDPAPVDEALKIRALLNKYIDLSGSVGELAGWVMLGNLYVENPALSCKDHLSRALNYYNKALEVDENYLPAIHNKIYCECALGNKDLKQIMLEASQILSRNKIATLDELSNRVSQNLKARFGIPADYRVRINQHELISARQEIYPFQDVMENAFKSVMQESEPWQSITL